MLLHEVDLMLGQSPGLLQLTHHDPGDARGLRCATVAGLPGARDEIALVNPLHRIVEVAHEVAAPELAVGEYLQAQLFLALEHPLNVLVFERPQLLAIDLAIAACLQQLLGSEQAAHMVRTIYSRHTDPSFDLPRARGHCVILATLATSDHFLCSWARNFAVSSGPRFSTATHPFSIFPAISLSCNASLKALANLSTIAGAVFARTKKINQGLTSIDGKPFSTTVDTSGNSLARF